jgi:UDP-N-acetylmuramoyl-L-alanyl-D-glutamate--2,6-diaminopimelate ligase
VTRDVLGRVLQISALLTDMTTRSRQLKDLVVGVNEVVTREVYGDENIFVTEITHDSKNISTGCLFCCVVGETVDGHEFAVDAINNGASAVLVERKLNVAVPQIIVDDVRTAMGYFAAEFFDRPSSKLKVIGITGTNGKTTTAHLLASVLRQNGSATAVFGTLSGTRTTSEATDLQRSLANEFERGSKAVVMEVSSHALSLRRVAGTRFAATIFTNLGQDHLDFHDTIDEYFSAKAKLFTPQYTDTCIVNRDDRYGAKLIAKLNQENIIDLETFGIDDASQIFAEVDQLSFIWRGEKIQLVTGGYFNVMNALAAANAAAKLGVAASDIAKGLAAADAIAGRFESVSVGQNFGVVVDYAHTPEALHNVLDATRKLITDSGRVIVVFGCGGDRDHQKRPRMGKVASDLADVVFITSDNPRLDVNLDRRDAIAQAFSVACSGDIVVIAGKGHESTQTIGANEIEFNDVAVSRELLKVAL